MSEIWKPIRGYDGKYLISNCGRIVSTKQWSVGKNEYVNCVRELLPEDNGFGYLIVGLRNKTKKKNHYVHRLVAEAFIPNPDNAPVVNHLDFNKKNNHVSNLEWCTQQENIDHSRKRMNKPHASKSNTGEKGICQKRNGYYEVTIRHIYGGRYSDLGEAIKKRNEMMKKEGWY